MKDFCLDLKNHATKIINYEKKEMMLLTKKRRKKNLITKKFVIYVEKDLVVIMVIKNTIK